MGSRFQLLKCFLSTAQINIRINHNNNNNNHNSDKLLYCLMVSLTIVRFKGRAAVPEQLLERGLNDIISLSAFRHSLQ